MSKKSQNLVIALQQVKNLEKLVETFDYPVYMSTRLNSIKYELERQLINCGVILDK